MDIFIPAPPDGSAIDMGRGNGGEVFLSWPARYRAMQRLPLVALLWVLALAAALAATFLSGGVADLLSDLGPGGLVFWFRLGVGLVLVAVIVGAVVVIFKVMHLQYRVLCPAKPVRMVLAPSVLRYHRSSSPEAIWLNLKSRDMGLSLDQVFFRHAILAVRITDQRLWIETSSGEFQLGEDLCASEREWLAGAIRAWIRAESASERDMRSHVCNAERSITHAMD